VGRLTSANHQTVVQCEGALTYEGNIHVETPHTSPRRTLHMRPSRATTWWLRRDRVSCDIGDSRVQWVVSTLTRYFEEFSNPKRIWCLIGVGDGWW